MHRLKIMCILMVLLLASGCSQHFQNDIEKGIKANEQDSSLIIQDDTFYFLYGNKEAKQSYLVAIENDGKYHFIDSYKLDGFYDKIDQNIEKIEEIIIYNSDVKDDCYYFNGKDRGEVTLEKKPYTEAGGSIDIYLNDQNNLYVQGTLLGSDYFFYFTFDFDGVINIESKPYEVLDAMAIKQLR